MDLLNDERVLDQFSSHFWDWAYIFLVIQSPKVLTKGKEMSSRQKYDMVG